ncbi:hypothetical protein EYF80_025945 [Liparis tanakae]|uniref:Uncharacterized protein n=1 Tax=Liparis tanakae TaxID=230148 RepID=A0A4Z2HD71_9TELE|nr:hypothetical protein EYF80_025945 [Liparis tanakae]
MTQKKKPSWSRATRDDEERATASLQPSYGERTRLRCSGQHEIKGGRVHLFTSLMESLTNCRLGSTNCITWSMAIKLHADK